MATAATTATAMIMIAHLYVSSLPSSPASASVGRSCIDGVDAVDFVVDDAAENQTETKCSCPWAKIKWGVFFCKKGGKCGVIFVKKVKNGGVFCTKKTVENGGVLL